MSVPSESDGPSPGDRWGCFSIGVLFGVILLAIAIVIGVLLVNPGMLDGINRNENNPGAGEEHPGQGAVQPDPGANAPDVIPAISNRTYSSGQTEADVDGFMSFDQTIQLDPVPSLTDDGATWLQFGTSGGAAPNITVHFEESANGVVITQGTRTAAGTEDECSIQVQVSGGTVSGHIACQNLASYDTQSGDVGTVSFTLDFVGNS